jgi:hypothetical protein
VHAAGLVQPCLISLFSPYCSTSIKPASVVPTVTKADLLDPLGVAELSRHCRMSITFSTLVLVASPLTQR